MRDDAVKNLAADLQRTLEEAVQRDPVLGERLLRAQADAAAFDAAVAKLNGTSYVPSDRRTMPQELRDFLHENRGNLDEGLLSLVVLLDRRGKVARCYGTQAGHFWPAVPLREEGKGAQARNNWASLMLSETYHELRGER